jgi:hypothetical protein
VNRFKGRGVLFLIRYRRRDKAIVNPVFIYIFFWAHEDNYPPETVRNEECVFIHNLNVFHRINYLIRSLD